MTPRGEFRLIVSSRYYFNDTITYFYDAITYFNDTIIYLYSANLRKKHGGVQKPWRNQRWSLRWERARGCVIEREREREREREGRTPRTLAIPHTHISGSLRDTSQFIMRALVKRPQNFSRRPREFIRISCPSTTTVYIAWWTPSPFCHTRMKFPSIVILVLLLL